MQDQQSSVVTTPAARFELLVRATHDAFWDWNILSSSIWWNEGFIKLFGYKETELPVTPELWLDYIHPDDRDRINNSIYKAIENTDPVWQEEYRFRKADGSYANIYDRGFTVIEEGKVIRMLGSMMDVTDRVKRRNEKYESEERMRLALDAAELGTWDFDIQQNLLSLDDRCQELYGFTSNETVIYRQLFTHIYSFDKARVERAVNTAHDIKSGGIYDIEFRTIEPSNGKHRWLRCKGKVYFTEEGKAYRFTGTALDISEQKRKDQILQDVEKRFQVAFDNASLGIVLTDSAGRFLQVNKAFSEMIGYTQNELYGDSFEVVTYPEDLPDNREKLRQLKNAEIPFMDINKRYIRKNGSVVWVNLHTTLIFNSEGKPETFFSIIRDITEERDVHLKLTASEERFRSMMEQSPVAIGVLRGKTMLIEAANEPLLHLWGKDESVIGLPLIKGLPELEGQPFLDLLNTVFETGKEHKGFETLARLERQGKIVDGYFNYVYSPMREGDGSISGVMVVATEVTGQVIAKKELEKSEQRFRNLVRDAPIPIGVYIGKEMVIQLANKAVLDTWGKDISVIGKTFREALPELEGQPFFALLDQVYTTGIPYQATEDRVDLFIDGRMQSFFFNFTYKPLRDSLGNVYGIINTATDVTEFVHAREGLKEAEEKLRIAVESAEMGTWNIDLRTGGIKVSERLNQLFGFSEEEINLTNAFTVIHPTDRDRAEKKLFAAIQPGSDGLYDDEYTIVNRLDHREFIIRSIGKVYFEDGKPQYITGTVQDITNRKMNEQLLETQVQLRTEELKNANRFLQRSNEELEQFAYVASHDLQEPLRKIRMFSAMLKEMNAIEKDITAANYLDKVISSAERMSNLIMDLLNFSRINIDTDLKIPVDLNQVVNQVKEDFELLIKQKNAVVHLGELPTIEAIPLQINQLFYNLLGNALKFTAEDRVPEIIIHSEMAAEKDLQMFPQLLKTRNYCMISIKDNGIGFESDLADKIFTIFQRLHIRSQYEGTGIGLALCKKIVVQHGGVIWASAEPDRGAEFCMILPIN